MDNDQLITYLILLLGFAAIIVFIKCWPHKEESKNSVLKYRKLNLLTGEITEITKEEMRNDIARLIDSGYDMALPDELQNLKKLETKPAGKYFVILNYGGENDFIEMLTHKLIGLNADFIFYRPIIIET